MDPPPSSSVDVAMTSPATPRDKRRSILTKIKSSLTRSPSKVPSEAVTPGTTRSRLGRSRTMSASSAVLDTISPLKDAVDTAVRLDVTTTTEVDAHLEHELVTKGFVEMTTPPPLIIPEPSTSPRTSQVAAELDAALRTAAEMERVIRQSLETTPLPPRTPVVVRINVDGSTIPHDDVQELEEQHRELRFSVARLTAERDQAINQLEALQRTREDMARSQGQLRGTIAQLEGTVASSDKRLRQQALELEDLQRRCERLQQAVAARPGTPAGDIAGREALARVATLERALARQRDERRQMEEFCATEVELLWEQEAGLREQLGTLSGSRGQHAALLSDERSKLMELHRVLDSRERDAGALKTAADKAKQQLDEQTRALQQAAANVRAAEAEVDLIHQSNEQYFRYVCFASEHHNWVFIASPPPQINYVRGQLVQHASALEGVPAVAHLVQELSTWCDKETHARANKNGGSAAPQPKEPRGLSAFFSKTPKSLLRVRRHE